MIDWRSLLTSIGTEWKDTGSNTSRGHININCPFCAGADPSYHLSINESTGQYYCRRAARVHSGNSPDRFLVELGVMRSDAFRLMRDFDTTEQLHKIIKENSDLKRQWDSFDPFTMNTGARNYMNHRGFDYLSELQRYDIRYADRGEYKGRVLFPLRYGGVLAGWTSRSIYDKRPLYKMEHGDSEGHIYVPASRNNMVVCEGPIDALKCVAAADKQHFGAVALLGKDMGPARLVRLQTALSGASLVLVCPDRDVGMAEGRSMIAEISSVLPAQSNRRILRVKPPFGHKDIGAAPSREIQTWAHQIMML